MPENEEANLLWHYCRRQLRMSFSGPVGIDFNAVFSVAEVLGLDMSPALLTKLRILENVMIEEVEKIHERQKHQRQD